MNRLRLLQQRVLGTGFVLVLSSSCVLMAQPPAVRLGFGFRGGFGAERLTGKTITGEPFSGTLTEQSVQTLANGTQIQRQEQASVYRDSAGRVRIDSTFTRPTASGNETVTESTIWDPVAGYSYRLNPQKMTAVQFAIRQRTGTAQPRTTRPADPTLTRVSLGASVINGVNAEGTQETRMIPAGRVGNTQAIQTVRITRVSTDLKIPVQVTESDPRTGTRSMNLTNIVQSEPSSSLFMVPSGYSITSAPERRGRGPR
jgi:hypothetical protein